MKIPINNAIIVQLSQMLLATLGSTCLDSSDPTPGSIGGTSTTIDSSFN